MEFTVHGQSAYCYTGGKRFDASLPVVVLIHGAQNDHSVWALQSRYLAHHGYAVLVPDLPGHGRSHGPALPSVEALADWLIALLDAAGVAQAALAGHSMGSLIALEASQRAPQRVTRLALIGTAWPMKVSDALLGAALEHEQSAIDMVNIYSHSSIAHAPSRIGPGMNELAVSQRLMQRIGQLNPEKVFHTDFSACNSYANGAAAAAAVRCPTLFLLARKDMMTPLKASAALSQAIPHSRTVVVEDCGHSLMAEQPEAVLQALVEFLW